MQCCGMIYDGVFRISLAYTCGVLMGWSRGCWSLISFSYLLRFLCLLFLSIKMHKKAFADTDVALEISHGDFPLKPPLHQGVYYAF